LFLYLCKVAKKEEAIGYFKQALECEDMWGYYETHICDLFYDMTSEAIPDNGFGVGYDDIIKDDVGEENDAGAGYFDFCTAIHTIVIYLTAFNWLRVHNHPTTTQRGGGTAIGMVQGKIKVNSI
jgi:hypothetical protein